MKTDERILFRQRFDGGGGVSAYWTSNSSSYNYNTWNHLVITYNSDNISNDPVFYLNGNQIIIQEGNAPNGTRVSDAGTALDISRDHSNNDAMNGKLDDIRMFSKELTIDEVSEFRDEGEPNLVQWQYSETSAYIEEGQVIIGSTEPLTGFDLSVKGKIASQEVQVTLNGWSDYVFNDDYDLQSLEQLESYIHLNSKLPGIPNEREVLKNGIRLGEMDSKLLAKIEELTLYLIEEHKMNLKLQKEIDKLKSEVAAMKVEN